MSNNFFITHIGKWVLRNDRTYQIPDLKDPKKNYEVAQLLHSLQDYGVTFKPMVIHKDNVCVSCEA